jgi:sulfite dehydrogenase (cytochrome) subunit B
LCVAAAFAVAADEHAFSGADESSIQLTDGRGRDLTVARCAVCHSLDYVPMNAPVMDRATWQKTVQKMRERFGAPITDDEASQILDYLSEYYADRRNPG